MLDNALIDLLATRLEAAASAGGWKDSTGAAYGVSQKQQPTQQGIPTDPQIFFEKLFDVGFGFPQVQHVYDSETDTMAEVETQLTETTFQISALVRQDPTDLSIPTASDVANFVRGFMLARATIRAWKAQGVSVLRVTTVRNDYLEDDRHQNEATPSFDLVLTHSRVINNAINFAAEMDGEPVQVQ